MPAALPWNAQLQSLRRRYVTAAELAGALHVSEPSVGRWLTGEGAPNTASKIAIAEVYAAAETADVDLAVQSLVAARQALAAVLESYSPEMCHLVAERGLRTLNALQCRLDESLSPPPQP